MTVDLITNRPDVQQKGVVSQPGQDGAEKHEISPCCVQCGQLKNELFISGIFHLIFSDCD